MKTKSEDLVLCEWRPAGQAAPWCGLIGARHVPSLTLPHQDPMIVTPTSNNTPTSRKRKKEKKQNKNKKKEAAAENQKRNVSLIAGSALFPTMQHVRGSSCKTYGSANNVGQVHAGSFLRVIGQRSKGGRRLSLLPHNFLISNRSTPSLWEQRWQRNNPSATGCYAVMSPARTWGLKVAFKRRRIEPTHEAAVQAVLQDPI